MGGAVFSRLKWEINKPSLLQLLLVKKYCNQLTNLNAAIQEKQPILANRKGVIFHHGNARLHVAKRTLWKLEELKWETLHSATIFSRFGSFRFSFVSASIEQFNWQNIWHCTFNQKLPYNLPAKNTLSTKMASTTL